MSTAAATQNLTIPAVGDTIEVNRTIIDRYPEFSTHTVADVTVEDGTTWIWYHEGAGVGHHGFAARPGTFRIV